ncbi:MAG: hypothetical protein GY782_03050 [Gammaproteobacteria bacterium]|nr:hypothetical protein [Gammaproteobacteria bacterium]
MFDYFGWSDLIVTHLSVRLPDEEALLINPFGVAFKEISAENLLKVDFDGNIIDSPHGHPLNLDNQVFSNLLIFILHLIAKINDLRGVDVKTVRIHQKT